MTHRIRSKWGLGLLALMLLSLGLAGCGSDEPMATTPAPTPGGGFQPMAVMVTLGESGNSITLMTTEAGGFTLNGAAVSDGDTHTAANGDYLLTLADGMWTATFVPGEVAVTVNPDVATSVVTLMTTEAGEHTYNGAPIMDGMRALAANGAIYILMVEDGMITGGTYVQPDAQTVALGASGTEVTLTATEESWQIDGMNFMSGGVYQADDGGARFTLTLGEDGMWTAEFVSASIAIEGTGLTAVSQESGYYAVGDDDMALPSTGLGQVMEGGVYYSVWPTEDGRLLSARAGSPVAADTLHVVGQIDAVNIDERGPGTRMLGLSVDDPDTPENEEGRFLTVGRAHHLIADLSASPGQEDMITAGPYIPGVLEGLEESFEPMVDLVAVALASNAPNMATGTSESAGDYFFQLSQRRDDLWNTFVSQLDVLWGGGRAGRAYTGYGYHFIGSGDVLNRGVDSNNVGGDRSPPWSQILGMMEEIMAAVATEAAFVAATADESSGTFTGSGSMYSTADAIAAYNGLGIRSTATMDSLGPTRFGYVHQAVQPNARANSGVDLRACCARGSQGAYSYSVAPRARIADVRLPATGIAMYNGRTLAMSGENVAYSGDIQLMVTFGRESSVSTVISNLGTVSGGEPWSHRGFGNVENIILPTVTIQADGSWAQGRSDYGTEATSDDETPAMLTFAADFGARTSANRVWSYWGNLVDGGEYANGTWTIYGTSGRSDWLGGGFGAMRAADPPVETPDSDDGTGHVTAVFSEYVQAGETQRPANMGLEDGMLSLTAPDAMEADTFSLATLFADGELTETSGNFVEDALDVLETQEVILRALATTLDTVPDALGLRPSASAAWEAAKLAVNGAFFGTREQSGMTEALDTADQLSAGLDDLVTMDDVATEDINEGTSLAVDIDEAIRRVQAAAQAFTSASTLRSALADPPAGSTGPAPIFTGVDIGEVTEEQILTRPRFNVKLNLASTEYTRFGVWSMANSENVLSDPATRNAPTTTTDAFPNGPGAFAYSPVEQTRIQTTNEIANLQLTGQARFVGETLALQGTTLLTGDVEALVEWSTDTIGGTMAVVISNLMGPEGDGLWIATDDGLVSGGEVRDVVFGSVPVGRRDASGDIVNNAMDFSSLTIMEGSVEVPAPLDGDLGFQTDSGYSAVRVRFAGGVLADNTDASGSMNGAFLGAGSNAAIGMLGTWALRHQQLGTLNEVGDGVNDRGVLIRGAFGAEGVRAP